ncbi:MAG: iron-sulfur cluster assembly protein, partial [Candidatus Aenigmatarchaeota archaeon]
MIKEKDLLKVLENVVDPEIGINIVDLGLIYDIKVEKDSVKIKMGLTS